MTQQTPRLRWGRSALVLVLCVVGLLSWRQPQTFKALLAIASYKWRPQAPTYHDQTLVLSGLAQPVRVHFDRHGIPHIDANNERDLMRVIGYVQAKDRFFQMDVLRRLARGRLSALIGDRRYLGSSSVALDRTMRGWGIEHRAAQSLARASAEEKSLLRAFCQGINAARKRFRFPEYRILGVTPTPFLPSDTYVIAMLHAWGRSHNWRQELIRLLLALHLGAKKASTLTPHTPHQRDLGISSKPLQRVRPLTIERSGHTTAGVVNGGRSSGKPLLANSQHLSQMLPSLLYQQHLRTPQLDVIGVTIPGIPYVLMGHNKHVAWGLATAASDVMTLVREKPHPTRSDRVLDQHKPCPLRHRKIAVQARGSDGIKRHTFVIRETCRGPLLNDMYPQLLPKDAPMVAVRWQPVHVSISTWGRGNRAKNVKALYQSLHRPYTGVAESLQRDARLLRAARVMPALLTDIKGMTDMGYTMKAAYNALKQWDYRATERSVGAAIFFATYRHALRMTMAEKLPPSALSFFLSQRRTTEITDHWFIAPKHVVWDHLDTRAKEERGHVIRKAFRLAVAQLRARQGDQVSQWRWGRLHRLQMQHPLGDIPLFGKLFHLPSQPGTGGLGSVWGSRFGMGDPTAPFHAVAGSGFRMFVDLGDIDSSRWILSTGASGWPGTRHYSDQYELWRQGKTVPMVSNWRTIINTRLGTWLMLPHRSL